MADATATAILLAHGPLRKGAAAELTRFVYERGGDIVGHDQYVDRARLRYYTRLEWHLGSAFDRRELERAASEVTTRLGLAADLSFSDRVPRIAIFVSNLSHCLYDILGRVRSGEWNVEVPLILSNHETLQDVAERFDVEFRHTPITATNKVEQESAQIALLREKKVELVVLARYMQIVGADLVSAFPERIINIHHALLPAFPRA